MATTTTRTPAKKAAAKKAAAPAPAELDAALYEDLDAELDALGAAEVDDWDSFWAAQTAQAKPARIRGVVVRPPMDMPLSLLRLVDQVAGSTDEAEHRQLLARIFGRDVFGTWEANGMGMREMQIVLVWAGAHMRGQVVTFEEAVRLFEEAEGTRGKARAPRAPKKARTSRRK